jgi:hypothetical protein
MEQRILTFSKRFTGIDQYQIDFDAVTKSLNNDGWSVKQIVSTSFEHSISGNQNKYPVLVLTLLVEK